jgi:hypothetical protein
LIDVSASAGQTKPGRNPTVRRQLITNWLHGIGTASATD